MRHHRRLTLCLSAAVAAGLLAIAPAALAQTPAASAGPIGMVEQPCLPGSFGRSEVEVALATALTGEAAPDPAVLAAYAKGAPERAKLDAWREKNDWADLCRYRQDDAADAKAGGVSVVYLGDSITELWRAADPAFFSHGVVNRGISGQTSGQLLLRFQQDVIALHPKAVHILVGTNDLAGNNGPNRPEDLKNNLRAMVALAKANHIAVVLGGIPPAGVFPWRNSIHPAAQIRELNAWMAAYAKAERVAFVDYGQVLADPEGAMKPGFSRDGVHPLKRGYALMEPLALKAVAAAGRAKP